MGDEISNLSWREAPLEDCMEAIIDYRGKTPDKTTFGIPLVTAKIVKDGRILPIQEFISPDIYDSWMRRGMPREGDVLVTTEAPLGEVAQLDGRKVALAQRLITLRGKAGLLDNTFLKYLLLSSTIQNRLLARSTGTTVMGIKQSELRKVLLTFPPLSEQKAIAHILGSLDDKIELNRKMNETLEEMASAIFKSWFVDFDPVKAKAEGRQPEGMDAETAKIFPDSFEDSELGMIPKGWKVGKLGDVASEYRKQVAPSDIDDNTPYIGLEHMPRRSIALASWGQASSVSSAKSAFRHWDILFGKLRPYFHKVGVAPFNGVCSTDIVVSSPISSSWFGFVLEHESSDEFVAYTNALSSGTRMPRTKWKDMARYSLVLPPKTIAEAFNKMIVESVRQLHLNINQESQLSATRDALLPKLLSGEIRIQDAEKFAEDAA